MAFTRYLDGDCNTTVVPVPTAKAVDVGSPVGIAADGTLTTPADQTWTTDLATTQAAFAATFAGASDQKKEAGKARVYGNSADNALKISLTGRFEATLAASANTIAGVTYLGPAKHPVNNALIDTALAVVSGLGQAIAVCDETKTGATKVGCRLLSARFPLSK